MFGEILNFRFSCNKLTRWERIYFFCPLKFNYVVKFRKMRIFLINLRVFHHLDNFHVADLVLLAARISLGLPFI